MCLFKIINRRGISNQIIGQAPKDMRLFVVALLNNICDHEYNGLIVPWSRV